MSTNPAESDPFARAFAAAAEAISGASRRTQDDYTLASEGSAAIPPPDEVEPEVVDPDTYVGAVDAYLAEAKWLTLADAPFKIHARKIAASLDMQLTKTGEVQSALASTFAKVLSMLDKRRPGPPPAPAPNPLTEGVGPHGEQSIFGLGMD